MINLLKNVAALVGISPARQVEDYGTIVEWGRIDNAVYVIGDVHGCAAELDLLLTAAKNDARKLDRPYTVVLLGDVIDRGKNSAAVLDMITRKDWVKNVKTIMGNHEHMFLSFLENPHANADWLDLGGFETLLSYGLRLDRDDLRAMSTRRAQQVLAAHIPDKHIEYLKLLPHGYAFSDSHQRFILTHAGYDAQSFVTQQPLNTLLWGKDAFHDVFGVKFIQGHVIVDEPDLKSARIRIDTGAYKTGRLTCLRICDNRPFFLISTVGPEAPSDAIERDFQ